MRIGLIITLIVAIGLNFAVIMFASTRQDKKRSIYFTALASFLLVYTVGYLIEIICTTSAEVNIALKFENMGIPLISPLFLLTIISLFYEKSLKPWMLPTALIYGVIFFLIILFNDQHHLYYKSIELVENDQEYFVQLERGILYAVQQSVSISLSIVAYIILFIRFFKGNKKLRLQMHYFIIGSFVAFAANILNLTKFLPNWIDLAPFAMTAGVGFVAIALLRYRLLDIEAYASDWAVQTMDDSMVVLDNDWCFLFCNTNAKKLMPQLAELRGTEQINMMPWWPEELLPRQDGGHITFQRRVTDRETPASYRANVSKITNERQRQIGWSIVIRDITDMIELMDKLHELATIDPLTGIFNRRHFLDLVTRELEKAVRHNLVMELIMYDLDLFKDINDTYGHVAGDHVLCSIVETVKRQLRLYDIFARYGGEEFVIFTMYDEESGMKSLATRLCREIEKTPVIYDGIRIPVTASFGVVRIKPGMSFDEAMLATDAAMYQAKSGGRNRVVIGNIPERVN